MLENITIGIKTFNREQKLENCLKSLVGLDVKEVIVADDGEATTSKQEMYARMKSVLPLTLITLPFDTGLAEGRNVIAQSCQTRYLLMLDDDQIVPANIADLRVVLEHDQNIGGISGYWNEYGVIKCDANNLYRRGKYVLRNIRNQPTKHVAKNITYFIYDFIPNSTLFRTECLIEFPWDPFYKIGSEHLDFYLTHKNIGKWKFAVTPDVLIIHDPKDAPDAYRSAYRFDNSRLVTSLNYLMTKWDIQEIILCRKHIADSNPNVRLRQQILSLADRIHLPPRLLIAIDKQGPKFISRYTRARNLLNPSVHAS